MKLKSFIGITLCCAWILGGNKTYSFPSPTDHNTPHKASLSETASTKKDDLSWEELQKLYKFPEWYTKARFGIWVTVGPQSVPRLGGGWYARHMFMQDVGSQQFGRNAYA